MSNTAVITLTDDDRICINDKIFDHDQLREIKLYFQELHITESSFLASTEEELDRLHSIVKKMGELSPEFVGENESYYLN
jgi:hypothetical protein